MQLDKLRKYALKGLAMQGIVLLLAIGVMNSIADTFAVLRKNNIDVVELRRKSETVKENGLSINQLSQLKDNFKLITYKSEIDTEVHTKSGNTVKNIKLVLTDANYFEAVKMDFIKGNFFTKDACESGKNLALISESTAVKLYKSFDCLGNYITINNCEYKVLGVYKDRKSIVSSLSSDGKEEIFIPYLSLNNYKDIPVSEVLLGGGVLDNYKFKIYGVQHTIGSITKDYDLKDYSNSLKIVGQFRDMILFLISAILFVLALINLVRSTRKLHLKLKERLRYEYFIKILFSEKLQVLQILLLLIFVVLCIFTFIKISFNIYIPQSFVPPYNLFDLRFYLNCIMSAVHSWNSAYTHSVSELEAVYEVCFKINGILFIISLILLVSYLRKIKVLLIAETPKHVIVIGIYLSLLFSILPYLAVVTIFHLNF